MPILWKLPSLSFPRNKEGIRTRTKDQEDNKRRKVIMNVKDLKIKDDLILCVNCNTPASWKLSKEIGWVGCAPCITGEAKSFDAFDLIPKESKDKFIKEFNKNES